MTRDSVLNVATYPQEVERRAREAPFCQACGCRKEPSGPAGLLVCWDCFKYRTDITPFKYAEGKPFLEWLATLPQRFDKDTGSPWPPPAGRHDSEYGYDELGRLCLKTTGELVG